MSWRNRKMFYDLPEGIASGLAPIPRYKNGGEVFPADKAINLTQGTTPQGVPYPDGTPGISPQVFDQGDPEINAVLNNMVQTVKGNLTAPVAPIKEDESEVMVGKINEEDSVETSEAKKSFDKIVDRRRKSLQQELLNMFRELNLDESANIPDQALQEIFPIVQDLDSRFAAQVTDMASRIGVIPTEEDKTILTDDFEMTISAQFPAMESIANATIAAAESAVEASQQGVQPVQEEIPKMQNGGLFRGQATFEKANPYYQNLMEAANRIRAGANLSGKTLQSGIGGTLDVIGQAQALGAQAAGEADAAMVGLAGQQGITGSAAERDLAAGGPLAQQELFQTLARTSSLDKAFEEFIKLGIPIPAAFDPTGFYSQTKVFQGEDITFAEFYRRTMAKEYPDGKPSYKELQDQFAGLE